MDHSRIKHIVIVGGGTSGWMSAALLSKALPDYIKVSLVESEDIGTIGVGEATIPHIAKFNAMLGIDEATFMKEVQATFKMGIEFIDWGALGQSYMHPFGSYGIPLEDLSFHHYWLRAKQEQPDLSLKAFSLNETAAHQGRFMRPNQDPTSLASRINYAYHFDASLYARFLRRYAEKRAVQRIEGKVVEVKLDNDSGDIKAIRLESGATVEADLYLDCTGFKGLLIEDTLHAGFEDWSHWLPMDSAVAVPSALTAEPMPFTVSTAKEAGWTWQIPLQHRMGNGHVFSSKYMDHERATDILLAGIDGELLAEPRSFRFTVGRRKKAWYKNCVAIGLSSGFIEPLESTAIHLVQEGLTRLITLLPVDGKPSDVSVKEYNRAMALSYERTRDFILLHYVLSERDDSPFWRDLKNLELPEILTHRMSLMRESGVYSDYDLDPFGLDSWVAVMFGQGMIPQSYNPVADALDQRTLDHHISQYQHAVKEISRQMPTHQQFIDHFCKAKA
ncbi:tryptophan halogenase family protein [Agaribacterium sp. ZY112]|uniref:tryptophan halogenase family protein n=1 Tax=Agaribacterium sp. ZY112 TaxID=3233574 RepID=UPI0035254870